MNSLEERQNLIQGFGLALLLIATSCSPKQPSPAPVTNAALLGVVQKIAAEHLKKPVDVIAPAATFANLGADDLDLVEITMAVEEQLNIEISDDALIKAAGIKPDQNLASHLTLRVFVDVAAAAPKPAAGNHYKVSESATGTLRDAQVGVYGELSKLPNPNAYELLFVPSLELLTAESERKLGRQMNQSERDALKERAAVVAVPAAVAVEFKRKRAEREASGSR